jgi:hypothetical protein
MRRKEMPKLRIEVFEGEARAATITIPSWLVTGASKLLPKVAGKELREHVYIEQIVQMASDPQARGTILEVEDHKDNERIVISIVGDAPKAA